MDRKLADRVDLLNTVGAELDLGRKELHALVLVQRAVDEGRLNNARLALRSLEQALSEASTSHSHGEGSRTSTILGLDHLITTELDAVDQVVELLAGDIGVPRLGDQRNDGDAGVATDDGDVLVGRVGFLDLGDEAGGADNVKGSDAEETLGVVDALALEYLGNDGNGGVDLLILDSLS